MRTLRTTLSLLVLTVLVAAPAAAQVSIGADVMSRYVWRGFDFGEALSIQPALEYSRGPVTVGTWASYSVGTDSGNANEHDLYISVSAGPFSFGVTDYYFPNAGAGFFEFGDGDGAHTIEPFVGFGGTESFPVSLTVASFVYNDPEYSTYFEASYPFVVEETELSVAVGALTVLDGDDVDGSGIYGSTSDFAVTNVSLSASRAIPITDTFSLPVGVSFVLNPDLERTYLVFGVSL